MSDGPSNDPAGDQVDHVFTFAPTGSARVRGERANLVVVDEAVDDTFLGVTRYVATMDAIFAGLGITPEASESAGHSATSPPAGV